MTSNLRDLLSAAQQFEFATSAGRALHKEMQKIVIYPNGDTCGDRELVAKIKSTPGIADFFSPHARTEIPIAGMLNKKFVSRRIDRIIVDNDKNIVKIMDYKTDLNHELMRNMYISQLSEYAQLLRDIYPNHTIHGYILWTSDFTLDQVI